MNRIRIPNKWDDESVAEAVPERHLAIEKRWKHPSRAKTTSEKPTENRGAHRADIDFGHQTAAPTVRAYAEGSAAAYSMQRSRILNRRGFFWVQIECIAGLVRNHAANWHGCF